MMKLKALPVAAALIGLSIAAAAWASPKGEPHVWLASELIGMDVNSQQGESLGKIEDIVVRPSGNETYAVLSFGGWLGVGDKLFAMPWSVLRAVEADSAKKDSTRTLVLPLAKERLKAAPGFDKKTWPNMANPDWTKDIDTFYVGDRNPDTKRAINASALVSTMTWKASELKGSDVKTPAGEQLGDLEELAIDTTGRVCYVTLSVGGFLGVGDRLIAVPWDLLKFTLGGDKADKKVITLASTKKQLEEAPQFKTGKENCKEMCDPKWITRVYSHYSCPVYWTVGADSPSKP